MHDYLLAPTVEDAARAACMALNLDFHRVPADGKFYRLTIDGRRKDGSLCLFSDGLGGIAKNFKTGEQQLFFVDGQKGMSDAELKRQQRMRRLRMAEADAARHAGHVLTATMAQRLWERLPLQAAHPYLTRKGVQNYGVRAFRHTLAIPVINSAQEIISLQLIAPDGARRFLKGGRVAGGFYVLGDAWTAAAMIIAEGYATAASLHEAIGIPVVVAFFAGNLPSVVEQWRRLRPEAQIVIAADDDWHSEGNPGVAKAKTAAFQFGALVAIPTFPGVNRTRNDTDFNDVARHFGVAEVRRQIEMVRVETAPRLRCCGAYEAKKDGLYMTRITREGSEQQRLTNFAAWVTAERIVDDGAERQRRMDIEAELNGQRVRVSIPANAFAAMNWPLETIGVEAVIEPGLGVRERARAAIQYLSGAVRQHHTYAHTGWRKLDHQGWCYLHTGGAIGRDGPVPDVDVVLPEALAFYRLPSVWTAEEVKFAVRASLQFLEIAPDRISIPLLGVAYRAVLGAIDFSVHLFGKTGCGKSELAALAQQHYGPEMTARHLPGAWFSTANQLEGLAFAAKDALFVIDEYVPEGTAADQARMQQTAARLFRGVGNGAGRGRADRDGKPRAAHPPRALPLSTGEDIPYGHSVRARMMIIEVPLGAIGHGDLRALSPLQEAALSGRYAVALAGFIHWLARDYEGLRAAFHQEAETLRRTIASQACHARTASSEAQLVVTWRYITRFAVDCDAIDAQEAERYLRRAEQAIARVGQEQASIQAANDPVERFRELLNAAVASGRAHIVDLNGRTPLSPSAMGWRRIGHDWQPLGHCIGWEDGAGGLYLEPEASYAAAQAMGEATSERIGATTQVLRKHLHEKGLLISVDDEHGQLHYAVRRTIGSRRRRVLHVRNILTHPETCDVSREDAKGGYSDGCEISTPDATVVQMAQLAHPKEGNRGKGTGDDGGREGVV